MPSVTSYFNAPLYQKNMTRFWPIWAGYTLFWMFVLPLPFFGIPSQYKGDISQQTQQAFLLMAEDVPRTLQMGTALSVAFGLAAAMAVFSYLFFNRSACMMHSLPFDRKGLFVTNYLSGLSFLLLPHLVVFTATAAVETLYGCLNLTALWQWLWVQSATALFFYSFAVFCAMFTGNIMAFPAFYGILNGLVAGVYYLLDNVLDEFLYGYTNIGARWEEIVLWLTPSVKLIDACDTYHIYNDGLDGYSVVNSNQIHDPSAVLIYAGIGLVLAALALWIYQSRHVESAGDVVAIPIVRPIFKVGVAVCAGMAFGVFTSALLGVYNGANTAMVLLIALWTMIGTFVAEMLLKKSFRVLHSWKSALVLSVCMGLVFTGLKLDWFGFESHVPAAGEVTSITITNTFGGTPYDDAHYGSSVVIEDEQRVKNIITLHQAILKEKGRREEYGDDYYSIRMDYTLKNGTVLSRNYRSIPLFMGETEAVGSVTRSANLLLQDREIVRKMYRFDMITPEWRLSEAYIDPNFWSEKYGNEYNERYYLEQANTADLERLWQAVQTDFDEGTIGVRYLFDQSEERMEHTYTSDLTFVFRKPMESETMVSSDVEVTAAAITQAPSLQSSRDMGFHNRYFTITLTPEARHTLACLEEMGGPTPGKGLLTHAEARALEETER